MCAIDEIKTPSDISNRLNEKMVHCCKPTQNMVVLKECVVKSGDGAKEKTRRTVTKINAQKLMGIVSPQVLSQTLRRGWLECHSPWHCTTTTTTTNITFTGVKSVVV